MCNDFGTLLRVRRVPRSRAVTAYRAWDYWSDNGEHGRNKFLRSPFYSDFFWEPGKNTYSCKRGSIKKTKGGFYGFKNIGSVQYYYSGDGSPTIVGEMRFWGTVYEYQYGFRASRCSIERIPRGWSRNGGRYDVRRVRQKYGV